MEYMTVRQYAEQKGVTYEAARRLVQKYRPQLKEHIVTKNRTQLLDEVAVEFLNEHRRMSPLVVVREDDAGRINDLERQVESLRAQLMTAQTELLKSQQDVIELQRQAAAMIETQAQYSQLLEDHKHAEADRDQAQAELEQVKTQLRLAQIDKEKAEQESQSYHKSWFGFYRKG